MPLAGWRLTTGSSSSVSRSMTRRGVCRREVAFPWCTCSPLWRDEGLRVPQRRKKKRLTGIGVAVGAMSPIRPNVIWAMDFQFDVTIDGRTLKMLNVIDEFTREAQPSTSIAPSTPTTSSRSWIAWPQAGAPVYVRFDNGPEFVAHAVADWCRFNDTGSLFIDPGSPWQNAWIESFNGRLRDELLNAWRFDSLLRSPRDHRGLAPRLQRQRPHTAHGDLTPTEFALRGPRPNNPQPHSDWTTKRVPPHTHRCTSLNCAISAAALEVTSRSRRATRTETPPALCRAGNRSTAAQHGRFTSPPSCNRLPPQTSPPARSLPRSASASPHRSC